MILNRDCKRSDTSRFLSPCDPLSSLEQPAPKPNDKRPTWELVIEDMRERDRLGRERYGTPLQPDNGRDSLVDAYHEALDLCVYLKNAIEERNEYETKFERKTWLGSLSEEQRDFIHQAESSGLLAAFLNAARANQPGSCEPKNPAKSLMAFFRFAVPHTLKAQENLALIAAFGRHEYSIIRTPHGIAAIFIDGKLSWFVPLKFIASDGDGRSPKVRVGKIADPSGEFQQFIKTRMGYVPLGVAPAFAAALQKKSFGAFADVRL
jgi:hypothetical protein